MYSQGFWEGLWKFYLLGTILTVFFFLNRKALPIWFFGIIFWLKEGIEDADGKFNSKDLWLFVFSVTLIFMVFLEWFTQKPFSIHAWGIISVLTTGRLLYKGYEDFKKLKQEKENKEEETD